MKINDLKRILKVFLTLQWAKELPRQGFIAMGFKRNEADSVAAHSFSTSLLAYFLAKQLQKEGLNLDAEKVLKMGLVHDIGETIVGDVGTFVKGMAGGVFKDIEKEGVKALTFGLDCGDEIIRLVEEYNRRKTLEARIVKVADNLDALAQAKGVPGARDALKYFKQVTHITKFDWHKKAVDLILSGEAEPDRDWQKKDYVRH